MNENNGIIETKQNPYTSWANLTALGAGLILFFSSLVLCFVASMVAMSAGYYTEPAANMFFVLTGCVFGPLGAFFLGLVGFAGSMIILRMFWKAPNTLVRLVIFGLSALIGIGVSLLVFGIVIQI